MPQVPGQPPSAGGKLEDDPRAVAPWAPRIGAQLYASMLFRVLYFVFILPAFFAVAVWMRLWVVVTVAGVGLVFANLFDQVTRIVDRFPQIKSLGPLGHALDFVVHLRDFYREHQPSWFIYYTFFPIAAPIACIFRPVSRKELRIWGKTFLVLVTGDVVGGALGYSSTYPPYLKIADALTFVLVHILFSVLLSVIILMPVMTTAFTLSLSGRRRMLGVISVISLLMMGGAAVAMLAVNKNVISFNSNLLLAARMKKPAFRKEIRDDSEILVTFLAVHSKPEDWASAPDGFTMDDAWTARFRAMISSVALNDEPKAFYVFHFRTAPKGPLVFGTLYLDGKKATILHVEDLKTHEISSWKLLPEALRQRLELVIKQSPRAGGWTVKPEMVADNPT